jgi:hypothetical protein
LIASVKGDFDDHSKDGRELALAALAVKNEGATRPSSRVAGPDFVVWPRALVCGHNLKATACVRSDGLPLREFGVAEDAADLALPIGAVSGLDQGQEPG